MNEVKVFIKVTTIILIICLNIIVYILSGLLLIVGNDPILSLVIADIYLFQWICLNIYGHIKKLHKLSIFILSYWLATLVMHILLGTLNRLDYSMKFLEFSYYLFILPVLRLISFLETYGISYNLFISSISTIFILSAVFMLRRSRKKTI